MSAVLPDQVDAWRMVSAQRSFEGAFPLRQMSRLAGLLALPDESDGSGESRAGIESIGECQFRIGFGRESLGTGTFPSIDMQIDAQLPLICQRTLDVFLLPLTLNSRLGLLRHESEEAGLPPEVEPLLVPDDGMLRLIDLVEDELILAIPVVPLSPASAEEIEMSWPAESSDSAEESKPNPFAELAKLKKH